MRIARKIWDIGLVVVIAVLLFLAGLGTEKLLNYKYNGGEAKAEGQLVFEEANVADIEKIMAVVNQQSEAEGQSDSSDTSEVGQDTDASVSSGQYVASSRGKKYYPVDCSAAKSLSPNNLIYFNSQQEAESAGYTKSASCDF